MLAGTAVGEQLDFRGQTATGGPLAAGGLTRRRLKAESREIPGRHAAGAVHPRLAADFAVVQNGSVRGVEARPGQGDSCGGEPSLDVGVEIQIADPDPATSLGDDSLSGFESLRRGDDRIDPQDDPFATVAMYELVVGNQLDFGTSNTRLDTGAPEARDRGVQDHVRGQIDIREGVWGLRDPDAAIVESCVASELSDVVSRVTPLGDSDPHAILLNLNPYRERSP